MPSLHLCCCVQAVQNFFGNAQSAELAIVLDGQEGRATEDWPMDDGAQKLYVYLNGEAIAGKIGVTLRKPGSKLEHQGLRIELIGEIESRHIQEKPLRHEFLRVGHELAQSGELLRNTTYDFEFAADTKKPYESYAGQNTRLRYYIRVTMMRRMNDAIAEQEVIIYVPSMLPEVTRNVKTEIGIGDTLHIELECNKWKYHLTDVVSGTIHFIKIGAEISSVELQIIKREITGTGQSSLTENEIVASFEILDGTPKTGDFLPIRLYLSSYNLTPTMRNIESRFTVKYYLNLVIMDDKNNKYFKQQELTLYRRDERSRLTVSTAASLWKKHAGPNGQSPTHPTPGVADGGGGGTGGSSSAASKGLRQSSVKVMIQNAEDTAN